MFDLRTIVKTVELGNKKYDCNLLKLKRMKLRKPGSVIKGPIKVEKN